MSLDPSFSVKKIENQLIAGIRFRGTYRDIPRHIEALQLLLNRHTCGSPMCLYFNGRSGEADMEVAFPITRAINNPNVKCHVLEGRHYISLIHEGPYGPPDDTGSVNKSWSNLGIYLRDHDINWETGPIREVFLEGYKLHRHNTSDYITELQVPVLLPAWLERFSTGVHQHINQEEASEVLADINSLDIETNPLQQSQWVKSALGKLTEALPNASTRKEILLGCAHRYPKDEIIHLSQTYQRLGSVEKLLEFMRSEVAEGRARYAVPVKHGHFLSMEKVPWDPERKKNATSDSERRAYHCHCGLVRASILADLTIDPTFCNCGAGWIKQLWDGILNRSVEVSMMESVLNGSDRCYFTVDVGGA